MPEKLVRNNIPKIIEIKTGKKPSYRVASPNEMPKLLRQKLKEEMNELGEAIEDENLENIIEGLADIVEVLQAMGIDASPASSTIEAKRMKKKDQRGGFDEGFVMNIKS